MTSVGLVANNFTIVNPVTLQEANISYVGGQILTDKDVAVSTQYSTLSSMPNTTLVPSLLVKTEIQNILSQLNSINIPTNSVTLENMGNNTYKLNGSSNNQNVGLLKMRFY